MIVRRFSRFSKKKEERVRINARIYAPKIRVIDAKGEQKGILPLEEGLKLAQEQGLDLVEIAPKAKPPVCRIIDFSKFKYEQHKRKREAQKKHKKGSLKEIRLRLHIGEHDYSFKLQQANKFLQENHKVKVKLFFKGREIRYFSDGQKLIEKFIGALEEKSKIERPPLKEGRNIIAMVAPLQEKP